MSLGIYSALEGRSPVGPERIAQHFQASTAKAVAEEKEQSRSVEQRVLQLVPNAFRPAVSALPSPPFVPRVIPPQPPLLSRVHARSPSALPTSWGDVGFPKDVAEEQKEEDHSSTAGQGSGAFPAAQSSSGATRQALMRETAALVQSRRRTRGSSAHSPRNIGGVLTPPEQAMRESPRYPMPALSSASHPAFAASVPTSPRSADAIPPGSGEMRKTGPGSAFLTQLAALIKAPQHAAPPLHRQLDTAPSTPTPLSHAPAAAPASVPVSPRRVVCPPPPPLPSSSTAPAEKRAADAVPPLPTVHTTIERLAQPDLTPPSPPTPSDPHVHKQLEPVERSENDGDDVSDDAAELSEVSPSAHAVPSDSDGDEVTRALSSLWSSAKRRQERDLRHEDDAARERRRQRDAFGKTIVTGGVIVQKDGATLGHTVRRVMRRGKREEAGGALRRMTLEERKAVKMAAVYRQHRPPPEAEEQREQEQPAASPSPRSHSQPRLSPRSGSSSPSPSTHRTAAFSATAPIHPARYAVAAYAAAPLPVRSPRDVAFGRTTPLSGEAKTKRAVASAKRHAHTPSLFDLAYGSSEATRSGADDDHAERRRERRQKQSERKGASSSPTTPAAARSATPGRSSHVVAEGLGAGMTMSIVTVSRDRASGKFRASAVPPSPAATAAAVAHLSQQQRATTTRTLPPPALTTSATKRMRMAPSTKARLDRLYAAHRATQARLASERAAQEEAALDDCTFKPALAPRTERLAERRRLQDEALVQQWEKIKARGAQLRQQAQQRTAALGDSNDPNPLADEEKADAEASSTGSNAREAVSGDVKKSRVQLMHDAYLMQQERLQQQRADEERLKAEQEVRECTFDPFVARHSNRAASSSTSPATRIPPPPPPPPAGPPPVRAASPQPRSGSVSGIMSRVSGADALSSRRTEPSYEEQFRQARWRQQQQEQPRDQDLDARSDVVMVDPVDGPPPSTEHQHPAATVADAVQDPAFAAFAWSVPSFSTFTDAEDGLTADEATDPEDALDAAELVRHRSLILSHTTQPHPAGQVAHSAVPSIDTAVAPHTTEKSTEEQPAAVGPNTEEKKEDAEVGLDASTPAAQSSSPVGRDESLGPLLSVDIAISPERVERMHLYDGDDISHAAAAFVKLHALNPAYADIIDAMLQAKLQDALSTADVSPPSPSPSM